MDKRTESKLASFDVGDKEWQVGYHFNDICDMEDAAACNLLEGLAILADGGYPTTKQLRGLLAAMIVAPINWPPKQEDQLKAVGMLIRIDTLVPIRMAIVEACSLAVSDELGQKFREAMKAAEAEVSSPPVDGAPAVDATV